MEMRRGSAASLGSSPLRNWKRQRKGGKAGGKPEGGGGQIIKDLEYC